MRSTRPADASRSTSRTAPEWVRSRIARSCSIDPPASQDESASSAGAPDGPSSAARGPVVSMPPATASESAPRRFASRAMDGMRATIYDRVMDLDPPTQDIHASVGERQRAEVHAAFAPRPRTCPHCGHVQTTGGAQCEQCGGDFIVRRKRVSRRRAALIAGLVVAVAGAAALAIVPGMRDSAQEQERAAAERQARLEAAERERLRIEIRPRTAPAPSRARRRGRAGLPPPAGGRRRGRRHRRRAPADRRGHRRRARRGHARARRIRRASRAPPRRRTRRSPRNRYQCIAYEHKVELTKLQGRERTGIYGVPYLLVIDYGGGPMTFCKISLPPGEGGRPLARVSIPEACRDPLR